MIAPTLAFMRLWKHDQHLRSLDPVGDKQNQPFSALVGADQAKGRILRQPLWTVETRFRFHWDVLLVVGLARHRELLVNVPFVFVVY
jgi:hypothetical protein